MLRDSILNTAIRVTVYVALLFITRKTKCIKIPQEITIFFLI